MLLEKNWMATTKETANATKRVLHFYSHKCLHLMLLEKNWMATY